MQEVHCVFLAEETATYLWQSRDRAVSVLAGIGPIEEEDEPLSAGSMQIRFPCACLAFAESRFLPLSTCNTLKGKGVFWDSQVTPQVPHRLGPVWETYWGLTLGLPGELQHMAPALTFPKGRHTPAHRLLFCSLSCDPGDC